MSNGKKYIVTACVTAAYIIILKSTVPIFGEFSGAMGMIPVALIGYFYGKKFGVFGAIGAMLISVYFNLPHSENAAGFFTPYIILSFSSLTCIGVAAGFIRDLLRRKKEQAQLLENEIEKRKRNEEEFQRLNEELEHRVVEQTMICKVICAKAEKNLLQSLVPE